MVPKMDSEVRPPSQAQGGLSGNGRILGPGGGHCSSASACSTQVAPSTSSLWHLGDAKTIAGNWQMLEGRLGSNGEKGVPPKLCGPGCAVKHGRRRPE